MAKINGTSTKSQRARLLAALIEAKTKGITTSQARAELNVMHPSQRVKELIDRDGHRIETVRQTVVDDYGREHHGVARYVLVKLAEVQS